MNKKICCFFGYVCLMLCNYVWCAEQPIVIVIPSYKNAQWVEKNLSSIFNQQYDNYRVIYIDDCSPDNTYELAQQITAKNGQQHRTTIIHNTERCGALANLYMAIHECEDNAIIVTVDGDDWLPHDGVLTYINKVYLEKDVWMTYGQFIEHPSQVIGYEYSKCFSETVIKNNSFRKVEQLPISHLRTFKAWLFKSIPLRDMMYQGNFYAMAWDKVMMVPMIEMAAYHHYCVPDVLYVYNNTNPINDHRVNQSLQHSLANYILSKSPYHSLSEPCKIDNLKNDMQADCIMVCQRLFSEKQLEQMQSNIHAVLSWQIIDHDGDLNFLKHLKTCLNNTTSHYILLCSDSIVLKNEIDLKIGISQLIETQADLLFYSIGSHTHETLFIHDLPKVSRKYGMYAWFCLRANGSEVLPVMEMTLWPKGLLLQYIDKLQGLGRDNVIRKLSSFVQQENKIGLMFSDPYGETECEHN